MISVGDKFIWWFGVVEDRNDPLKLGRVRVRCYGWHTDNKGDIPTNTLPWAQPIQSITSGAMGNIGESPTGIVEGTWVIGFFMDGDSLQKPIIMGTLAGIPVSLPNGKVGFNDPSETYPNRIEEPDVNRLARNDTDQQHAVLDKKEEGRTKNVSIANSSDTWNEQESKYAAQYPKNQVRETESGHIKEYDDTENNTRIHEYHKAGTFYEIDNEGNKVTRIVGDSYQVVAGANYVNIKGDVNLTIDSNCNTHIKKDWNIQVDGNVKEVIKGTYDQDVTGAITVDGSTINLNNGTKGAARLDDVVDTGDDPPGISGSDGSNRIETSSKTVIIGD